MDVSLDISKEDVELRNLRKGMDAFVKSLTYDKVIIKGEEVRLNRLTLKALAPYIDLSNYTTSGTYFVEVSFQNVTDLVLKNKIFAEIEVDVITQSEETTK